MFLAIALSLGLEHQHDRFQYHFDNPSSISTPFNVPHFFEQRYSTNKNFLVIRARYGASETEVAATPSVTGNGSDFDTFFQPDGDVVVHGRRTDLRLRSWRFQHAVTFAQWRGFAVTSAYSYSRDAMTWPSSAFTTSHTKPPSVETGFTTSREDTRSEVHELRFRLSRPIGRVSFGLDLSPLMLAQLTTHLPDKYPGQAIRFAAPSFGLAPHASVAWRAGAMEIVLSGEAGWTSRYSGSSSFKRQHAAVGITIGAGR